MRSPLAQTSSIERVYRRIPKVLQRFDRRSTKGKFTHFQRCKEAQQMVQSYDDEATALVGLCFPGIPNLTLSDTGCKQWLGPEDSRKWYPLLDFGHINSPPWARFIFASVLSRSSRALVRTHVHRTFFSSGFPCTHARTHF